MKLNKYIFYIAAGSFLLPYKNIVFHKVANDHKGSHVQVKLQYSHYCWNCFYYRRYNVPILKLSIHLFLCLEFTTDFSLLRFVIVVRGVIIHV